jgi:beta-glucosidase
VDAVLLGFLPGPLAGQAVMDLITGRGNPSAKLPISYPKYESSYPYMHAVSDLCTRDTGGPLPHYDVAPCEVQWPFGHGLSYTTFEYSQVVLSTTELHHSRREWNNENKDPEVTATVTVKNIGKVAGAETVLVFTFDEFRSTTPEYKRLRGFEKVWLEPDASTTVSINIPLSDLRFVGPHDDSHYIYQHGMQFRVGVGAQADCRGIIDEDVNEQDSSCSPLVTITTEEDYVGACEAACDLWGSSGCADYYKMTAYDCYDMCGSIHKDSSSQLQMNNDGWYVL